MDIEKAKEDDKKNKNLKSFIKMVKESKDAVFDGVFNFKKRLALIISGKTSSITQNVVDVLKEVVDDGKWNSSK